MFYSSNDQINYWKATLGTSIQHSGTYIFPEGKKCGYITIMPRKLQNMLQDSLFIKGINRFFI